MSGVVPWSYSSLTAFEQCPRRFQLTRVLKTVTEPQTEQTLWGNRVHKALENAVGKNEPLGAGFEQYEPIVNKLKAFPGLKQTEQKFGLTKSLKPTTFFGKDVWVRGVLDLTLVHPAGDTAIVADYKTGKVKDDFDQCKLFAGTVFAERPRVETVKAAYIWLAHNKITTETFHRSDAPAIWQEFIPRVARMERAFAEDKWPANPSGLCKAWCPVGRKNCVHCGKD
jgi:hypothetical protein